MEEVEPPVVLIHGLVMDNDKLLAHPSRCPDTIVNSRRKRSSFLKYVLAPLGVP